jgi:hypothetical protein
MRRPGEGNVSRWIWAGPVLAAPARIAIFLIGLTLLGGVYWATRSDGLQQLVLFGLVFLVMPITARLGPRRGPGRRLERTPSWRAYVLSGLFVVAFGAATWSIPTGHLGPWWWWWLVMIPSMEAFVRIAAWDIARHGGKSQDEYNLARGSAVAGLVTAPAVALIDYFLAPGDTLGGALGAGAGCGVIVFVISLVFGVLAKRAQATQR